ncbi:metallophosphoesterase [Moraxella lacunata]|nr:metallophosphoesterase [Moraxella lacunata]MDH9219775.1 metallophosphoesterase [Moraxella lacunata]
MYQERKFFAVLKPNLPIKKILVHDKKDGTFVYQYTDINAKYGSYDDYYDCQDDALLSWQDDIDDKGWQEVFYFNSSRHSELPDDLTFLKEKPMIYFTSDWHFSHKNIVKFCPTFRTAFDNIDDMDNELIERWNATVRPDDVVYNLGDVSFSHDLKMIEKTLSQLNGKHHLILGNHDGLIARHQERFLKAIKKDGNPMLSSVQDYLKLTLRELKRTLILFHYPIDEWDGCHKGYYHLHGHIHDRMAKIKGKILNVGYDLHGRFLTLDDIDEFLKELPNVSHFGSDDEIVLCDDVCQNAKRIKDELLKLNA